MAVKKSLGKIWHFIWYDDSILSWIVNLILAFILVKFVIYPGIGFALDTDFPIVAVVSGSMEHEGQAFDTWWENNGNWYESHGITKKDFVNYKFFNGFNKGDIMFLKGEQPKDIKVGDVLVYQSSQYSNPIIHRVVETEKEDEDYVFMTKGDNNNKEDKPVLEDQIENTGKAIIKLPYLGWVKIWFVDLFTFVK